MAKQIKTTGELRRFLCDALVKIENGAMDAQTAKEISKMSAQINESLYAEVKVAKIKIELGENAGKFGSLGL